MPPRRLATLLKKWPLGLSPPASFWWSSGIQPMIEEGNRLRSPEKTLVLGQQTIREGMHSLHERPATDLFSHELSTGWTWSTSWMLAHVVPLQAAH